MKNSEYMPRLWLIATGNARQGFLERDVCQIAYEHMAVVTYASKGTLVGAVKGRWKVLEMNTKAFFVQ